MIQYDMKRYDGLVCLASLEIVLADPTGQSKLIEDRMLNDMFI